MNNIIIIASGILGLIVGSFLNVVILRMNTGMGLGGRSKCFSCTQTLQWYELIPLVSFIIQKGKCRKCLSGIDSQYPLVEAATAVLFMLPVISFGFNSIESILLIIGIWVFASFAIVISVYDIRHLMIPWQGIIGMAIMGIVLYILNRFNVAHTAIVPSVASHLFAMIALPLPFFCIWLFSKGKMFGIGDVELMVPLGFSLGLVQGVSALLIAFWSATLIIGIVLILRPRLLRTGNKRIMKKAIPFGPFLLLGWYIALVGGQYITTLIASFFL